MKRIANCLFYVVLFIVSCCIFGCNTNENVTPVKEKKAATSFEALYGKDTSIHYKNKHIYHEDESVDSSEEESETIFTGVDQLQDHFGEPALDMEPLSSSENVIIVNNVNEFIDNITSNATIYIESETGINLTAGENRLPDFREGVKPGVYRENGTFLLYNLTNLTIKGTDPNFLTHVYTEEYDVDVIQVRNCSKIQLRNLKLGHKEGPGCTGDVVSIYESSDIEIDNCNLYGSGYDGLVVVNSANVNVTNSIIYDCSNFALFVNDTCSNVLLNNCVLKDCTYGFLSGEENSRIEVRSSRVCTNIADLRGKGPLKFTDIEWFEHEDNEEEEESDGEGEGPEG